MEHSCLGDDACHPQHHAAQGNGMNMVGAHLHAQRNFPFFAESKGAISSQRLGQGKRSASAQEAEGLAYGMRESKIASLLFRMRSKLKHYLQKEGISV